MIRFIFWIGVLVAIAVFVLSMAYITLVPPNEVVAFTISNNGKASDLIREIYVRYSHVDPKYRDDKGRSLLQIVFLGMENKAKNNPPACWEVADYLVKNGVPVDNCDQGGVTALHTAAMNMNLEQMQFLLDRKANMSVRCTNGNNPQISDHTPLEVAKALSYQSYGHYDSVIAFLRAHGGE